MRMTSVCLQWHCCGVDDNGWAAYRQSNWYKDHPGANRKSVCLGGLLARTCDTKHFTPNKLDLSLN